MDSSDNLVYYLRRHQSGFSLIELLVIVSIISLLSSIVLSGLNVSRQKARDAVRRHDLHQIHSALELFYTSRGTYPATNQVWNAYPDGLQDADILPVIPMDPGGSNYHYENRGVNGFVLMADLEAGECWYNDTEGNRELACQSN